MSRYRKIEVRIWADDKFRALSPLQPSGQSLWLFLLTGPHTGPIPGLFRAGKMAMAEELGWSKKAFSKAFDEIIAQEMAQVDWKNRVAWLPKAIIYNLPQSPNVIKSWAEEIKLIPKCPLKDLAIDGIRAEIEVLGKAYLSVFDEITNRKPFAKSSAKSSGNASGKTSPNQEQEQEQEQEQKEEEERGVVKSARATQATEKPSSSPSPEFLIDLWNDINPDRPVRSMPPRRRVAIQDTLAFVVDNVGKPDWPNEPHDIAPWFAEVFRYARSHDGYLRERDFGFFMDADRLSGTVEGGYEPRH